ncbi:hypothetical protein JCM24511_07227 [Saitozyma sp. JCM 24511]|nr:hypothetical protein JCM24511_07227 [Saitozyma sp. JCM 24511]
MPKEAKNPNAGMDRSFLTASIPELLQQLTLDEKISMLAAKDWWHIKVTDGPAGARGDSSYNMTEATSFPNATCLAATFSLPLAESMGKVLASEAKARGALCLLAPTINIQRNPRGGRAFESFAEDPTLSGHVAAAYINGLQGAGVSATIKHFVCNDLEHERMGQDVVVGERALREVYLRPFHIAQRLADPWAYMTGYNKVNGLHCSENPFLLDEILRKEWRHNGIIMSDWFGTYSVADSINAGLTVEFPGAPRWRTPLLVKHVHNAYKIDTRQIDKLVGCLLGWVQNLARRTPELVYKDDVTEWTRWSEKEADASLVRKIVTEGIVVMKNERNILPVTRGRTAIIGPNAKARVFTGGGSARIQPAWSTSPWEGFVGRKPDGVNLEYALGCATAKFLPMLDSNFRTEAGEIGFDAIHYKIDDDTQSTPIVHDHLLRSEVPLNDFNHPVLGYDYFTEFRTVFTAPFTGEYEFGVVITGKGWFYVDGKLLLDISDYSKKDTCFYGNGTAEQKVRLKIEAGKTYHIRLLHDTRAPADVTHTGVSPLRFSGMRLGAQPAFEPKQAFEEAVELARNVDTAIVVCGLNADWESEGEDRPTLNLPLDSNSLIDSVANVNANTIVVLQGGSALAMPWLHKVKGVVFAWYGGAETGNGIADVVYGHVNPSGRLPLTFPWKDSDTSATLSFKTARGKTYYDDGIWVGYKHHNARKIPPMFPFGHGLSYTSFEYEDLKIASVASDIGPNADHWKLTVQVAVKNTGAIAGDHSVHFYTAPPPETSTGLLHPEHTLQAFTKTYNLKPGEKRTVEVTMDKYAISHWDEQWQAWRAEPGEWVVKVGRDAQTMAGHAAFTVKEGFEWLGI